MTYPYTPCILIHMRTTLILEEELIDRAREATGIDEKTALVRAGLRALIEAGAARRLADLGGTDPDLPDIPRRKTEPSR